MDMDKRLLDSLNNLSIALQDISDSLKSKSEAKSATAKAMKGGNFSKEIKEINIGVIQLKKDTKQILANQQTIMNMGKNKSKGADVAEGLGKDKQKQKNFKDGIGVILLIAVAVLALGIAFNLVGKVNFLSVIALSIALPLLAIGFAKVHTVLKQVGFDAKKDGLNFVLAMVAISISVTLSSWILSMVAPVSFTKMLTIILIGVGFSVLSPAILRIIQAFKGMSFMALVKSVIFLPLILPAIALGIALASWAFQLVKPVGFSQMFTTIFIALAFTVISFGIRKLLQAFKGIGMDSLAKSVIFLPLILPAIALGIALSSYALQLVKPIGIAQLFTTIFIALAFTVIAFGIRKLIGAFKGLTGDEILGAAIGLPFILVAISYAIALSSRALSMVQPIGFSQFLTALGIAIIFVVISFAAKLIIKAVSEMKMQDVFKLPLFFVAVSIAIWLSSEILSKAKVIDFTKMLKIAIFSVVLAIAVIAIGVAMFALSKLKVSVKDAIIGALLIVIISVAIMVSSHILSMGKYDKYPDWKWALGVGLSLLAFIPAVLVLGSIAMSGVGALAILAGAGMVLVVAATIMATSHIISKGKYDSGGPKLLIWTLGTVAAMVPFALAMVALGIIALSGIGAVAMVVGAVVILGIASTIVATSHIISKGKYDSGGPKLLIWTLGTVAAMVPFALAMVALGIIALSGIGAVAMVVGAVVILGIASTIVATSHILAKGKYTGGPPLWWALSTGIVMTGFGMAILLLGSFIVGTLGFGFIALKAGSAAVSLVAQSIVDASLILQKGKYTKGPTKEWAEGVAIALGAFSPIYSMLMANGVLNLFGGGVSPDKMSSAITTISRGILDAANTFNDKVFKNKVDPNYMRGLSTNIRDFAELVKYLNKDDSFSSKGVLTMFGLDPVSRAAKGMNKMASAFDKLATSLSKFSSAIKSVDGDKVNMIRKLTGNIAILSSMDSKMFNNMMTVLEKRSSVFSKLLDSPRDSVGPNVGEKPGGGQIEVWAKKTDQGPVDVKGESALQKLDRIAYLLDSINRNVDTVDDLVMHIMSVKKEEKMGK